MDRPGLNGRCVSHFCSRHWSTSSYTLQDVPKDDQQKALTGGIARTLGLERGIRSDLDTWCVVEF